MVEYLPPDSALHRRAHGHTWQDGEYLLAEVADAVRTLTALTAAANSKHPRSVKMPKPLPRPKDEAEEQAKADRETEAAAVYDDLVGALTPQFSGE